MSEEFSFLRPPILQHHRLPPPYVVAWDGFTWRDVILALYVWNRLMTKEERRREQEKSSLLRTNSRARYRELQRNITKLHDNRPSNIADIAIADPNADNSDDNAVVPRRSSRNQERADAQNFELLVARAVEHASDPDRQARARLAANAGGQRSRAAATAAAAPPVPVNIVGLGSSAVDRLNVVRERQVGICRNVWKKRKQGTSCTSIGMQGDATATSTVNAFHRSAAIATETLYCPDLVEGQPKHAVSCQ